MNHQDRGSLIINSYSCYLLFHLISPHTRYMKYTLDQVVEQDYTVLYCHYGLTSHNKPRFAMLRQMYKEMDRK